MRRTRPARRWWSTFAPGGCSRCTASRTSTRTTSRVAPDAIASARASTSSTRTRSVRCSTRRRAAPSSPARRSSLQRARGPRGQDRRPERARALRRLSLVRSPHLPLHPRARKVDMRDANRGVVQHLLLQARRVGRYGPHRARRHRVRIGPEDRHRSEPESPGRIPTRSWYALRYKGQFRIGFHAQHVDRPGRDDGDAPAARPRIRGHRERRHRVLAAARSRRRDDRRLRRPGFPSARPPEGEGRAREPRARERGARRRRQRHEGHRVPRARPSARRGRQDGHRPDGLREHRRRRAEEGLVPRT